MFAALALTRSSHFAALCLLFGLSAFPFYTDRATDRLFPTWLLLACSVLVLITGVLELLAMVGNMGETWRSAFDPGMLTAAITDTGFGRVWLWRLGLAFVTLLLGLRSFPGREAALLIASGVLLASIALTGHAPMPGGLAGKVHQVADALHLLAAGWWMGGLLALLLVSSTVEAHLPQLLAQFSRAGYAAVALLIVSGLVNSLVLVSPLSALWTTSYGFVLLAKIGLFAAMGLVALSNRFQVSPALAAGTGPTNWRRRLLVQVGVEFGLAVLVLLLVGGLGAMSPPLSD